eukprot:6581252-Pyramimonas_sp.AAC.1
MRAASRRRPSALACRVVASRCRPRDGEVMKPGWFRSINSYETTATFRRDSVAIKLVSGETVFDHLAARAQQEVDFPRMDSPMHERVFKVMSVSMKAPAW